MPNFGNKNKKISTITPTEQIIYVNALRLKIVRPNDLVLLVEDMPTLLKHLSSLSKKGYLKRVRNGLYIAVPPEYVDADFEGDKYLLASRAYQGDYVLSHHTALELLGVAQSHMSQVFISIPDSRTSFEFQGNTYVFVYDRRDFGVEKRLRDGITLKVTDKERTFLDCIRRPKYAGGVEEVLKSFIGITSLDFAKMTKYLGNFEENSLYQRTGFVLNLLREELSVPVDVLLMLKGKVGKKRYYLDPHMKPGQGRLDKDFNVIAPANIKEVVRGV